MSDSALRQMLRGETRLPVMPTVASRLLELQENPDTSLAELSDVISLDVYLASTLLRYANSAAYNLVNKVETVERAAVVLGFNAVREISLSLSLTKALAGQPGAHLDYNIFWQRSLLAAEAARVLGKAVKEKSLDELFLAGLLQDIGLLALDRVRPELYAQLGDDGQLKHRTLVETEQQALNFDHAKFGGALLQEWGMHERTVKAVLESHSDHAEGEDMFAACVATSGFIADFFLSGGGDEAYAKVSRELYRVFSIRDSQCMQILLQVDQAVHSNQNLYAEVVNSAGAIDIVGKIADEPEPDEADAVINEDFASLSKQRLLDDNLDNEGVMGPAAFESSLKNSFRMLRGQPVSVAMVSINNLYELRTLYGDKVITLLLKVVSRKILECIRIEDFITRYGDTFAIILLGARAKDAVRVVDRIVNLFEDARYTVADGNRVALKLCAGVAGSSEDINFDSEQQLMNGAAMALQRARKQGDYVIREELPERRLMELG